MIYKLFQLFTTIGISWGAAEWGSFIYIEGIIEPAPITMDCRLGYTVDIYDLQNG